MLLHKPKLLFLFFVSVMLLTVNAQPVVNFTANDSSGCGSLIPVFQDLSTTNAADPIISWDWDFGDGTQHSLLQNPSHIYNSSADSCFDVTLTIITQGGSLATITKPNFICVHQSPVILPPTIVSPTSGCSPACFKLNANLLTATSVVDTIWEIGSGNVYTGYYDSICLANPGFLDVTLLLIDVNGCISDSIFKNLLQVLPSPVANFVATTTSSCQPPLNTSFGSLSTYNGSSTMPAGTTYSWFFPGSDLPSTTGNPVPSVNYTNSGNYNAELIVTTPNGCTDTLMQAGYIGVGAVNVGMVIPDTVCAGQAFTVQGTGAASYSWFTPCTSTTVYGTTQSIVLNFPTAGTYCVKVIGSNGTGCSNTKQQNIVVSPSPSASFIVDKTTACSLPTTFNFDASASTGTGLSYSWDFGAGAVPTAPFVTNTPLVSATYSTTGNKTVTLTVMNSAGCKATSSQNALLSIQSPVANFAATPTSGCAPLVVQFSNASTSNDPITGYSWSISPSTNVLPPPATQSIANPTFVFGNFGNYDVTLHIITAQGCVDSVRKNNFIHVGTLPVASFTYSPAVACVKEEIQFNADSVNGTWQYAWDFNHIAPFFNTNSSLSSPNYPFPDTGKFEVCLGVMNNGCGDTICIPNAVIINGPKAAFSPTPAVACGVPASFSFTNTSKNAATGTTTYNWYFNASPFPFSTTTIPAATTPVNPPSQNYNGPPTTIPVKLYVFSSSTGCTDSLSTNLIVGNPIANFTVNKTTECRNVPITFTPTGSNASQYMWIFGDGTTATSNGPTTHAYTSNGVFTDTLIAIDANQCQDTMIKVNHITITGPIADFYATDSSGCTPFTTTFHDSVIVYPGTTITNYKWTFPITVPPVIVTGIGPAFSDPTFTFQPSGSYSVNLTVTDSDGCTDSKTKGSFIQATYPNPMFTADDTVTCAGNLITFTPQTPGSTYVWTFGDGNFATTQGAGSIQHAYLDADSFYTVKVVVTDINGCKDSLTKTNYIYIEEMIPNFYGSPTSAPCPPLLTTFHDSSMVADSLGYNIAQWEWHFGDVSQPSTLQNPSHIYNYAGTFDVTLIVTHSDGCQDSVTKQHFIQLNGPYGEVQIQPNPPKVCPGDTVTFTIATERTVSITYQPETSVLFVNPNNPLIDTTIIKYVYTIPGIYTPKFIIKDAQGCAYDIPNIPNVTVYQPPVAAFTTTPSSGCLPLQVAIVNNSVPGVGPTGGNAIPNTGGYVWDFGDNSGTIVKNPPPHSYVSPNTYNITLIVKDNKGCKDTAVMPVIAYLQPIVDFDATPRIQCAPAAIEFQDLTSVTVPTSWSWNFGDGSGTIIANTDTIQHSYFNDGYYDVTLTITDANGCIGSLTKTQFIHLRHPVAQFFSDSLVGCEPFTTCFFGSPSVSDTLIDTYFWTFGDVSLPALSNLDSICHTYANPGQYDVYLQVTDILGCKDDTLIQNYITVNQTSIPQTIDVLRVNVENKSQVRVDYKIYPQPDFRQYLLYRFITGQGWVRVDSTSNLNQLSLYDNSNFLDCENNSYCYKVLVQNDCRLYSTLGASETHCTTNATSYQEVDRIKLNWNPYKGWGTGNVNKYEIYRSPSATYNPSLMTLLDTVGGDTTTYTDNNIFCADSAYYRIVAIEKGGNAQISWGDVTGNVPTHLPPTQNVEMRVATVEEDKNVVIRWNRYLGYKPAFYSIEKSKGGNVWKEIATAGIGDTSYIDTDVWVDSISYAYRVFATDSCGDKSRVGLIGKTILLRVNKLSDETPSLSWTKYIDWRNDVQYYEIQVFDEENDWTKVDIVDLSKTTFEDYKTQLLQGTYCYRIVAHELTGNDEMSISNEDCITFEPKLWAPNVFTPNNDGNNDVFYIKGPNITSFDISIYDRWGKVIYVSKVMSEGWDGIIDGKPAVEGTYMYRVTGKGDTGDEIKLNGSVNLIR